MSKLGFRWLCLVAALALLAGARARAEDEPAPADLQRTPPRLSFTDGEVSFWRSGAEDWSPAEVNTPLSEGDQLYAGPKANLEIQIGSGAFVRAGEETQLGITNLEPDFLQLRIVTGHASVDLRSVKAGTTVEIDTPNAAFTVEHTGYYRIEVTDENTSFTSRRGGSAAVTPANGQSASVAASETVVVSGTDQPQLETYAAAELDDWDRWNYTRTDQLLDAVSSRYVPSGVYGVDDLDHYGDWRVVPTYGAVWMPRVAPGWVPYSTGSWVYDPYYGWTWVDAAPWGWAPFHYGRWVAVGGYWGWAPGPLVVRPYYSPALVAFYGAPSFSIGIGFGSGSRSWVALGWGEPCIPWWGPSHFRGAPHWQGWGGPRIVNNVVINKTTVVNVNQIHGWSNASHNGAVVGVPSSQFGRGRLNVEHFDAQRVAKLRPLAGDVDVKPGPASLAPSSARGERPPRGAFERTVVATREPKRGAAPEVQRTAAPMRDDTSTAEKPGRLFGRSKASVTRDQDEGTAARLVTPPKRGAEIANRPPFGTQTSTERSEPPRPPRFGETRARDTGRDERAVDMKPTAPQPAPSRAQAPTTVPGQTREAETQRAAPPSVPHGRGESHANDARSSEPPATPRNLPGEPANRVFRGRSEQPRIETPPAAPQQREVPQPRSQPHSRTREQPRQDGGEGSPPSGSSDPGSHGSGQSHGGWGRGDHFR
jgi:hypothetical protein